MGILIEKLRRAGRAEAPRIGFGAAGGPKAPAVVLIAGLNAIDVEQAKAAKAAGADAIAFRWGGQSSSGTSLAQAAEAVDGLPIGVIFESPADLGSLKEAGASFALALPEHWSLDALKLSDFDRIAIADLTLPPDLLRTLEQLPFAGIAAMLPTEKGDLTSRSLMEIQRIVNLVRKPMVLHLRSQVDSQELQSVRELGVEGIWLEVPDDVTATIAAAREAIDALPATLRTQRSRIDALVPSLAPRPNANQGEDDE